MILGLVEIFGTQREFNLCELDDWNKLNTEQQKAFFMEKMLLSGIIELFVIHENGDLIKTIGLPY